MNDSISRQAAIKELELGKDKKAKGEIGGFYNQIIEKDIEKLKKLPSTQPEVDCQKCIFCGFAGFEQFQIVSPEIIRCKDCRYDSHCAIQAAARTGNTFFCGAAKRKKE